MSAVRIRDVLCAAQGRTLLHIASLDIAAGERAAVIGPNGAGKSTLLRLIGGLMPIQYGRLEVLGRHLHAGLNAAEQQGLRCELGQIMQGLHLVPRLSAQENVLIGALGRLRGWRSWARYYAASECAQARQALHAVGMLAQADMRADKLSGGERQKVAIARLLMQQPKLILADEPTAALDPAAAADVCSLLARAAEKATLISVVHNPALLPVLATRVIGLKHGRIAFDCATAALSDAMLSKLYRQDAEPAAAMHPALVGGLLTHTETRL